MISVDEALNKILSHIQPLGFEKVSILDALGRVIAEDMIAPVIFPLMIIRGWTVMRSGMKISRMLLKRVLSA